MKRVRAYSREDRKRLIIDVLARKIRIGANEKMTAPEIANAMDITASTKLRQILAEMIAEGTLRCKREDSANIAGFRMLYWLNDGREGFHTPHNKNRRAERCSREIKLNAHNLSEIWRLEL